MKTMIRLFAVMLAVVLCIACLAGCRIVNLDTINESIENLREDIKNNEQSAPSIIIQNLLPEETPEPQQEAPLPTPETGAEEATPKPSEKPESGGVTNITYNDQTYINNNISNNTTNNTTTIVNQTIIEERPGTVKDSDEVLGVFSVSESFFIANQSADVVFTVEVPNATEDVLLYNSTNTTRIVMHDDGLSGDAYADDGIYTAVQAVSYPAGTVEFWAKSGAAVSNHAALYFFEQPTEESAALAEAAVRDVRAELQAIEDRFARQGFVPASSVGDEMTAVGDYLEGAMQAGDVLLYEIEDGSAFIKMPSGVALVYEPLREGVDSGGSDVSMTVITCQPSFTGMGGSGYATTSYTLPTGVGYVLEMPDDAAEDIDDAFDNYSFSSSWNWNDDQVTLRRIRELGPNEIVLWHGHGYYGPIVKSCLVTGEAFDWNAYWWDLGYFNDCVTNRIVNGIWVEHDTVIISSGYIRKYCGNLDNSFLYLAACSSGKHDGLAKAFLDKGAAAVVANTDTIIREYNVRMLYETAENMLRINEGTQNYYTLQEALRKAKSEYGESDADRRYGGIGSKPMIFGGADAENYRFAQWRETEGKGTLSGRICMAADRSTPVVDANILVMQDGALIRSANADSGGEYTLELPAGVYRLDISAPGFIPFGCYVEVEEERNTYVETFLLVEGEEGDQGTAEGCVFNALTGEGVGDVSLTVRSDWNNRTGSVVTSGSTGASGQYSLTLPIGNYTVTAEKAGFITGSFNIVVQVGTTPDQNGSISPVVLGDDFRIVLTWGQNPRDLDSHVVGPLSNGSSYHVYFNHKSQRDNGVELCNLDVDDITSYGPETITLTTEYGSPVYYYVHLYAGYGTLGTSEAQVRVYQGESQVAVFNVPTNQGNGRYWNVFAITGGELTVRNTITSEPEATYAGTGTARVPGSSDVHASDLYISADDPSAVTGGESVRVPDEDAGEPTNLQQDDQTADTDTEQEGDGAALPPEEPGLPGEEPNTEEYPVADEDGEASVEEGSDPVADEDGEAFVEEGSDPVAVEDGEPEEEKQWPPEITEPFDTILSEWMEAVETASERWTFERLSDFAEFLEQFPHVDLGLLLDSKEGALKLYSAYYDIDSDETPELLLGMEEVDVSGSEEAGHILAAAEAADGEASDTVRPVRIIAIYRLDGERRAEVLSPEPYNALQAEFRIGNEGDIWLLDGMTERFTRFKPGETDGISADSVKKYRLQPDAVDTDEQLEEEIEYITRQELEELVPGRDEVRLSWKPLTGDEEAR